MKTRHLLPLATLVFAAAVQAAPAPAPAGAPGDLPPPPPAGEFHRHHDGKFRHHDGQPPAGAFLERFDQRADLQLTDAQKQKLKALGEEERSKHDAIRKDYQKRFDAVLTKEQHAKLDAERDARRAKLAERLEKRSDQLKERAQQVREGKPAAPAAR